MNNILKELTIQDFLAVMVSLCIFILIVLKYPVPEQVWSAWMVIITFFFTQPKANTTTISTTQPAAEVSTKVSSS